MYARTHVLLFFPCLLLLLFLSSVSIILPPSLPLDPALLLEQWAALSIEGTHSAEIPHPVQFSSFDAHVTPLSFSPSPPPQKGTHTHMHRMHKYNTQFYKTHHQKHAHSRRPIGPFPRHLLGGWVGGLKFQR